MSKKNEFLEALKAGKKGSAQLPGLEVLRNFCQSIKEYVGETIECDPVPGANVNFGQEYKVVITYYPSSYSSTLLRAYLNLEGRPYLDLYDQKGPKQCQDVDDFREKLVAFLKIPGIADMLAGFKAENRVRA